MNVMSHQLTLSLMVCCAQQRLPCVYVMAKLQSGPILCLLDSRCERSVIGRRYVSGLRLK